MLQTQSTRPAPKTNDMGASREWATRPADERFWTIEDMHQAVVAHKERTIDIPALLSSVEVGSPDRRSLELYTGGDRQTPATFTNFSFGQICERVKAAKPYLTTLPAPIVADCLNYGLSEYGLRTERGPHSVTFEVSPDGRGKQGAVELRCVASEIYNRIWNADITDWLRRLPDLGWRVPPARPNGMPGLQTRAATQDDVLNDQHGFLSINVGDMIAPAGLYASDRDCFAFFVNEEFPIDTGDGQPMSRAFYVSNAEVPGRSFRAKFFGYEHVCGNHIIWGARLMADIRVRHIGTNADEAVDQKGPAQGVHRAVSRVRAERHRGGSSGNARQLQERTPDQGVGAGGSDLAQGSGLEPEDDQPSHRRGNRYDRDAQGQPVLGMGCGAGSHEAQPTDTAHGSARVAGRCGGSGDRTSHGVICSSLTVWW